MKFLLQIIDNGITLDMCSQMERAKEFWDLRDSNNTFNIWCCTFTEIENIGGGINSDFKPEEWCPIGTVEFVDKYLRTYFGDEIADKAMIPLNIPECFLKNKMNTGRKVINVSFDSHTQLFGANTPLFIKDNVRIHNTLNGIKTIEQAQQDGLTNIQCSQIIPDNHLSSEWRVFIHNGKAVDIKNYAGDPFVFPDKEAIDSYMYQLDGSLKEGVLDVYVDTIDEETYVMKCNKFFSCDLYGFNQLDILPLMFWKTYNDFFKNTH